MPLGDGILRVPKSWGALGKSCNKLPALTKDEAKRTVKVLGKIGPGGYFKVLKILNSKTFKKYFARGRMEISSSGGDNITSGDESESRPSRGDLQHDSPSRNGSVEYLGVIREDTGRVARRAFPDILDLTLLSWLREKVQNPFSNLFPSDPSISSDSRSESLYDSGLSLELRSHAMSSRGNLSTLTKKAGEKKATTKDAGSAATSQPPLKGVVIQEKHPREDTHDPATKEGEVKASKGKEAMPPPPPHPRRPSPIGGEQSRSRGLHDVECPYGAEDIEQCDPSRLQVEGRAIQQSILLFDLGFGPRHNSGDLRSHEKMLPTGAVSVDHGEIFGRPSMETYPGDVGKLTREISIWRVSRDLDLRRCEGENLAMDDFRA
ncbi:hypothetical protein Acr_10g0008150 [Actinidia rufa]|uniref:Uncharacterized protein n=1 Tax=Actinidia rufa TaxID=165716 RepID=A0A7J0F9Q2_9ERIC|nr:hypothetical protein Acr_10g0008150 [Actinidia rufa]